MSDGIAALLLARHGESVGNMAASAAEEQDAEVIDAGSRDADVPLSPTGVAQAEALGERLRQLSGPEVPEEVWVSPYRRAVDTAMLALGRAQLDLPLYRDERLRDRELGVLDLLTTRGVRATHPGEAERRRWLGKFYHRPPGGESWADVVLRLRSFYTDLDRVAAGRRIFVVSHDAVIILTRYICERMSEQEVLALSAESTLLNASLTRLDSRDDGDLRSRWTVGFYNDVDHLHELGVEVTRHSGDPHVKPG